MIISGPGSGWLRFLFGFRIFNLTTRKCQDKRAVLIFEDKSIPSCVSGDLSGLTEAYLYSNWRPIELLRLIRSLYVSHHLNSDTLDRDQLNLQIHFKTFSNEHQFSISIIWDCEQCHIIFWICKGACYNAML